MDSQDRRRESAARKLTKKRKEARRETREASFDVPERFQDGDDAHEDVTAPKRSNTISMNQSIFSMIARAGQHSQTDLGTMLEADSADSDDEADRKQPHHNRDGAARLSRLSSTNEFPVPAELQDQTKGKSKHRRTLSENKLLRSLPKLTLSSRREGNREDHRHSRTSASQILPPGRSPVPTPSADVQSSKHKGDKTVEKELHVGKPKQSGRRSRTDSSGGFEKSKSPVTLAKRLQQIFEFDEIEEVISEYPCWLLQSILLQGYMYITQRHICFYAYIPKKHHEVSKTGYLFKHGRSKYNRYWFILRGDVLSYYTDPAEPYFPRNRINLQYAISADVVESKRKLEDETTFIVTTDERTYRFKADSAVSAKEWTRSIQKVIFRTHNEGNSVKISLPIQNVLEIEESSILDFADTVKVRVIDNDETFAIDEYFFSFFNNGQDALNVLRIMINDNVHHQPAHDRNDVAKSHAATGPPSQTESAVHASFVEGPTHIKENVRATLSPLPAPFVGRSSISDVSARSSTDVPRKSWDARRSMDTSRAFRRPSYESRRPSHEVRRSFSGGRHEKHKSHAPGDRSPLSPKGAESESASLSLEIGTESSAAIQSLDESNLSASQLLDRSDVFRTHNAQSPSLSPSMKPHRRSDDTARSIGKAAHNPATAKPGSNRIEREEDSGLAQTAPRLSGSSSAIPDFATYPIQKASGLAGFLRTRSKRMGNLLATESMGYYEKVSGMLAGGRKHYNTAEGLEPGDQIHGFEDEEDTAKAAENFREHFAFPETEILQSSFFAYLQRVLPNYGKIYISGKYFCFRSLMPTSKTKIILPIKDVENVNKEKGFRLGYHGLAVVIRGHEELFFEFSRAEYRDECAITLLRILESTRYLGEGDSVSSGVDSDDEAAKAEHDLLQQARERCEVDAKVDVSNIVRAADHERIPLIFDDPLASFVDFKPSEPLTIVCLTIGSRGDVQPYISLCKELLKEGHKPRIATHAEFEPWVRKHGIDFAPVDGNPAELMRICVEHGMFTYNFMKEANSKFRGWLDDVCSSSWRACQGADVLIESPSAMAGIHIAEALEIPYFRAFTMPWTRTRAYPHAFSVLEKKMGGGYNNITYITFDTIFWTAISGQINKWRRRELGLQNTSQNKMQASLRPFLYNFSPHVVPPPLDWPDWVRVTGYWFLDEGDTFEPPADLLAFIEKARKDNKKLVYVGFGSIVIDDPAALTRTVVDSVLKADVRCVLSKGWSDRLETKDASKPEIALPPEIFQIQAAPHDWLFKQMDAAVHHGGSGTTGASLRAGIPTIIKPFFGDQFFFAQRVEDMGVGIWLKKVNTSVFSRALWEATNSQRMIVKARVLGQRIRKENGTQIAIQTIYRELDRARTLIKKHTKLDDEHTEDFEDDWTLIEDGEDIDMTPSLEGPLSVTGLPVQSANAGGPSTLALGSMVLKGASGGQKR